MLRALTTAACLTLAALAAGVALLFLFGTLSDTLDSFRRAADLDARAAEAVPANLRRGNAKERAAEDALAGRLTLPEAAAVWRDLDAGMPPGQRESWRLVTEGDTDDERYCRLVLATAAQTAAGRPGAEAAVTRLRRQLEEALAAGDLRLPGPEAPRVR